MFLTTPYHPSFLCCSPSLPVSPSGQWLASGAADGEVRLWEVDTGRCVARWTLAFAAASSSASASADGEENDGIVAVAFNPNPELPLLAVAAGTKVLVYHTMLGSEAQNAAANTLFRCV